MSLTPELEKFAEDKVSSGLYGNASEVIREGLRLLKEHDELRKNWPEQIERGCQEAQRGELVDGRPHLDAPVASPEVWANDASLMARPTRRSVTSTAVAAGPLRGRRVRKGYRGR